MCPLVFQSRVAFYLRGYSISNDFQLISEPNANISVEETQFTEESTNIQDHSREENQDTDEPVLAKNDSNVSTSEENLIEEAEDGINHIKVSKTFYVTVNFILQLYF